MIEENYKLDANLTPGCGCAACKEAANNPSAYSDDQYNVQFADNGQSDLGPEYINNISEQNSRHDLLNSGYEWNKTTIYFNFVTATPSYYNGGDDESSGFVAFTASMKDATREILTEISKITNLSFVETTNINQTDMAFGQASLDPDAGAWAYYPTGGTKAGDVWTNTIHASSNTNMTKGGYGYYVLWHEIGHALGLKHTFEAFNLAPNNNTIDNTEQYSVMAYNWSTWGNTFAESYMLYDIAVLQEMYGVNTTHASHSGNNTYTLRSGDAYAIWDGGGTDTLDGSHITTAMTLNLGEGQFSSVGQTDNITIAWNAVIENANGGSAGDLIYGNEVNNAINGNGGNDTIFGSAGNDTLNGGEGTDTLNYSYNISEFIISLVNSVTLSFQHIAGAWTDVATAFENFIFSGTSYTFAELEESYGLQNIGMRFNYSGGSYNYTSAELGNTTLTADSIGNSSITGNAFSIGRTGTELTVSVLNANAADTLSFWSGESSDTINLTGTDATLNVNFYGRAGDDYIGIASTITGNDVLGGDDGDDTIYASAGNDKVYGGTGADRLFGGADNDQIWGGSGDDYIYGDNQARSGQMGNDILSGEDGNDNIFGGDGNDQIWGGADNDIIGGDAGDDRIYGGTGIDTIYGNAGHDFINGDDGNDTIYGDNLSRTDTVGNDTIYGDAGDDIVYAGDGDDTIYGDNHQRAGVSGNDIIHADAGNDRAYGGDGNDTIHGGDGNDILAGDAGNDTLNGDAGNDELWGHSGDDVLNGGDGNDKIYGDYLTENAQDGNDTINGGDGDDTLVGWGGNDILIGGNGRDYLWGGTGDDRLEGGAGIDIINGGGGDNDWVIYENESSGVTVNLTSYYGYDGGGSRDSIEQVEHVLGSAHNDRIYGNNADNALIGEDGDDYLYGWDGADELSGGNGNDILYGGNDNDQLSGDAGNDVLGGDAGNDSLNGGLGNDQLWGHSGNDTLNGGDGDDKLYGDYLNETGQDGNDILNGGNGNDLLVGRGGNDILNGGAGVDELWGGTGEDTFVLDDAGSVDRIRDFSLGDGDHLDLSDLLSGFYTNPAGQAIEDFVRITENAYHTFVEVDQNGGGNSFVHVATLYNVTGLTDESAMESSGTLITI